MELQTPLHIIETMILNYPIKNISSVTEYGCKISELVINFLNDSKNWSEWRDIHDNKDINFSGVYEIRSRSRCYFGETNYITQRIREHINGNFGNDDGVIFRYIKLKNYFKLIEAILIIKYKDYLVNDRKEEINFNVEISKLYDSKTVKTKLNQKMNEDNNDKWVLDIINKSKTPLKELTNDILRKCAGVLGLSKSGNKQTLVARIETFKTENNSRKTTSKLAKGVTRILNNRATVSRASNLPLQEIRIPDPLYK